MRGEEKQVKRALDQIGEKEMQESVKQFNSVIAKILAQGVTPKDAMNFTEQKMETIYAQGYRLYNSGKYEEASYLFRLLTFLDATDPRYPMGIAACLHMLKEYANAAQVYTICSLVDPNNPVPYFHASDCYIQMNDKASAILALEMAVEKAGNTPAFQVLKDRAKLTIDSLKKDIANIKKE